MARLPYQCLQRCGNADILVGARGSQIDSFSLKDGSLLSTWNPPTIEDLKLSDVTPAQDDAPEPPAKRRRLSITEETQDKPKPKVNARSNAATSGLQSPAITAMTCTKDGKHVIVVTGEDKSIRVFKHEGNGQLQQLSQRAMPKRPCKIVMTDDDETIISADKFGDVFSLPLTPSETSPEGLDDKDFATPKPDSSKPFVPAANEFTIHSVRNRKALENQKRHTKNAIEKIEPTFEHKLLLGHVSMLTDVVLTKLDGRNYIITSDRDEHIRISRGIPQSHIIEGFCLGHSEFISRLCIPTGRDELLISGGGDEDLFVWHWVSGKLLSKVNLGTHVRSSSGDGPVSEEKPDEVKRPTVSGIHHTRITTADVTKDFVIVLCEAVAALFVYTLIDDRLEYHQTVPLPGNALSIADSSADKSGRLVVSFDFVHQPGSTKEVRQQIEAISTTLATFTVTDGGLASDNTLVFSDDDLGMSSDEQLNSAQLSSLLYGMENLRKREGAQDEE